MSLIEKRRYLNRVCKNVKLYLNGRIKWSEIEDVFGMESLKGYDLRLENLYEENPVLFKENILCSFVDNYPVSKVHDYSQTKMNNALKTKCVYLMLDNPPCTKTMETVVDYVVKCGFLDNTEKYFLGKVENPYLENVFGKKKGGWFKKSLEDIDNARKKIYKNFSDII